MPASPIEEILEEIRSGNVFILVDDESADGEGFLCAAAEKITPEAVNFMMLHGRGLICVGLTEERMKQLGVPLMVQESSSKVVGSLGASIALRADAAAAASAASRARTLRAAVAKRRGAATSSCPAMSFPCRRGTAACWSAPPASRLRSTLRGSRASRPAA